MAKSHSVSERERLKRLYRRRWQREQKRRALRRSRRARRYRKLLGVVRRPQLQRRLTQEVTAPKVFSFIKDPAAATTFIQDLGRAFRTNHNVYVNLRDVEELTSDAVVVLLSRLTDPSFARGMKFGGNEPQAEAPRQLLNKSGFFEFVISRQLKEPPENGRIMRKTAIQVDPEVADEMVQFATQRMNGKVEQRRAAYDSLIELMANTHEHSNRHLPGVNFWWANVYCPAGAKRSFFTVVDNGAGIFKSMTIRAFRRQLRSLIGNSENTSLLRDVLEGRVELPSRTGLRNRGKGLRAIHKRFASRKDGMQNLVMISNDVYAHLEDGRYEVLDPPFDGTLVYWEVNA